MKNKKIILLLISSLFFTFMNMDVALAAPNNGLIDISIGQNGDLTESVKVFLIIGLLALAPSLVIMSTCFTQVIIVLGLTRQALGTMTIPPNQVLTGLALFITFFIMSPVFEEINEVAYQPYQEGEITFIEGLENAEVPLKEFMLGNTYDRDLELFLRLRGEEISETPQDISLLTIIPAYSLSQIEKGLVIGLSIYIIYTVIDILVGSILMFMGMMMLPPQMVSLPLKLLIFVFIGGFSEIVDVILNSIKI